MTDSIDAPAPTTLLVEPNQISAARIGQCLNDRGIPVRVALTVEGDYSVLILGPGLDFVAAADYVAAARSKGSRTPTVYIAASSEAESRARLFVAGADRVVDEPVDDRGWDDLSQVIASLQSTARAAERLANDSLNHDALSDQAFEDEPSGPATVAASTESSDQVRGRLAYRPARVAAVALVLAAAAGTATIFFPRASSAPSPGTALPTTAPTATPAPSTTVPASPSARVTPTAPPTPNPVPSPTSPTATVRPSPAATATPETTPPGPTTTIGSLPAKPQLARLVFTPSTPLCDTGAVKSVKAGVFRMTPWGQLILEVDDHLDYGSLNADGTFDVAGADPLEHWHGTLATTGGAAAMQTPIRGTTCSQTYEVLIVFMSL